MRAKQHHHGPGHHHHGETPQAWSGAPIRMAHRHSFSCEVCVEGTTTKIQRRDEPQDIKQWFPFPFLFSFNKVSNCDAKRYRDVGASCKHLASIPRNMLVGLFFGVGTQ